MKLLSSGAALAVLVAVWPAQAIAQQNVFVTTTAPIDANPTKGRDPGTAKSTAENGQITIGDVLFSGNLLAGGVYNDNLYSTRFNKQSAFGFQVAPSFSLQRSSGLHTTSLSANLNSQFYASNSDANITTGGVALNHIYEVQRDLIVYLQARASRGQDNSSQALGSGVRIRPLTYDQQFASASVEKSFDKISVGLGGTFLSQQYSNVQTPNGLTVSRTGRNGNSETIVARVGYAVTPLIQAFIQPTYNWQSFDNPINDSQGYTITAGLRSDRIGLFRGEIFGGYRHQTYDSRNLTSSGPTFGGSISWFPTRELTLTARVSQSYGLTEGEAFQGGTGVTTTAALNVKYDFSQVLTASAYASYSQQNADNLRGSQDVYTMGAAMNYMFTTHLGVNLGYTFTKVNYSVGYAGYQRNLVSLGANARF